MENVLLVDDELMILDAVGSMLEYLKHRVWKVGNAESAMALLRGREHFDLALIDLALRGKSGLDLIREIRSEQPTLPIIVISGYVNPDSVATVTTLHSLGITQVLAKPIAPGDLDAAIKAVMGRTR